MSCWFTRRDAERGFLPCATCGVRVRHEGYATAPDGYNTIAVSDRGFLVHVDLDGNGYLAAADGHHANVPGVPSFLAAPEA